MKHTQKRILSILAAAALTFCTLPQSIPLLPGHAITLVENPEYEFETAQIGNAVQIIGWNGKGNSVVIPTQINGHPVTAIGDNAFSGNKALTRVSIPDSITAIGTNAFADCEKLESISIPKSVTEIGSGAFEQTAWLTAKRTENPLVIVNTVLVDGGKCTGTVQVPDGITTIADTAFYGNASVEWVILPETVAVIGDSTFEACTMLESISLSDQLTSIGDHAFDRCIKLQTLHIGENVLTIGEDAFKSCTELTVAYYNNPYAARYMEENNIEIFPSKQAITVQPTAYPGEQNVPVTLYWSDIGSDIYMLRLFHYSALKPVYSEKKPDQIKYNYYSWGVEYENSSPYNPEICAIDILNPRSCTYYFDIPQDTKPGVYPLILQIITPDINDDETLVIPAEIEVLSNLRGDADGDGIISKEDAEAIRQFISSGNQEGLTKQGESNADVDRDGLITASDASAILHYLEKGYFPDEEPVQTGTTTAPVTTTSAANTVTTTTTTVPSAEIILIPPAKTRYTVGEPLDFSDMSCKVFFTSYTSEGEMSIICQEAPLLFDLPGIIEMGNVSSFSEPIQGVLSTVNVTFSGLNIGTDIPGVHTVKVTVTTEDNKVILAEKSFNVTVKPKEPTPVTTSTTAIATTTTAKATTTTAKATATTAKAATTTAKATATTAKATATTVKAATTTAKATTTTAKATTTTTKAATTTAKATTTTAKAATTTAKATTTTAKAATTTAKAATTAAPATTTIPAETTPIVTTSAAPAPLRGDINGDGTVSVDDAQLTLKAYTERIAGNDMKLTAEQIKAADVDGSGEISVEDAQWLLKYYTEKHVAGNDITWDDILGKKKQALPRLFRTRSASLNRK